jgi:hypothetical protein
VIGTALIELKAVEKERAIGKHRHGYFTQEYSR